MNANAAVYPVPPEFAARAQVTAETYETSYAASIADPEAFWAKEGRRLRWSRPYTRVKNVNWDISRTGNPDDLHIRWFEDGLLNVAFNCIDRHLPQKADTIAIQFEGDDPAVSRVITYSELYSEVCRFANVLKALGVGKGDRVTIYLPMIPEAAFAMLACARIGAIHSVVFGGVSPEALAGRIADCGSTLVITADEGVRGGRVSPMKAYVDEALRPEHATGSVKSVLVIRHTGADIPLQSDRDIRYEDAVGGVSDECQPEEMTAEDPLFILYPSDSSGESANRPRGVVHSSGGYLVWASLTHQMVFDHRPGDVFWCADTLDRIAGHTHVVYGPLANGATTLMVEGAPDWPDASRLWKTVDRCKVSVFCTSSATIQDLMGQGDRFVGASSRASLRLLASVGEPIHPDAWEWYHRVVGDGRRPVVAVYGRTESGGALMAPLPGAHALRPGSVAFPAFGVRPELVDADGGVLQGPASGRLCIADSWPGQARTHYGDHAHFVNSHFRACPGKFVTGDSARRDEDGRYWITGRA